jgi:hypothetical protein
MYCDYHTRHCCTFIEGCSWLLSSSIKFASSIFAFLPDECYACVAPSKVAEKASPSPSVPRVLEKVLPFVLIALTLYGSSSFTMSEAGSAQDSEERPSCKGLSLWIKRLTWLS